MFLCAGSGVVRAYCKCTGTHDGSLAERPVAVGIAVGELVDGVAALAVEITGSTIEEVVQ